MELKLPEKSLVVFVDDTGRRSSQRTSSIWPSPDISPYLCTIEAGLRDDLFDFCGQAALWRRMTRELAGTFSGCGGSEDAVSGGLGDDAAFCCALRRRVSGG